MSKKQRRIHKSLRMVRALEKRYPLMLCAPSEGCWVTIVATKNHHHEEWKPFDPRETDLNALLDGIDASKGDAQDL